MANEKRPIDANALMETLERYVNPMPGEHGNGYLSGMASAMDEIEAAPTVYAAEVVRCGQCKQWVETEETGGAGYCQHPCWTTVGEVPPIVQFADFCSYGEMKDNG